MDVLGLIYDKVCGIEKSGNANTEAISRIETRLTALEKPPSRSLHPVASMTIGAVITVLAGPLVGLVARTIAEPVKASGDPNRVATDLPAGAPPDRRQYQARGP